MKNKFAVFLILLMSVFLYIGAAQASVITFDEVPLYTTDPTIGGVSFWAGAPASFFDTYVDDAWSPGNPYLASGKYDATGNSLIGVSLVSGLFGTVTFDVLSEEQLPGAGAKMWLQGMLLGSPVGNASFFIVDNYYHNMSLAFANGADTLVIYDDSGEAFHIDNFNYTSYQTHGMPEPATLVLLLTGLFGTWAFRKRST